MHPRLDTPPVLIAGAGPSGLTAAITLARYGVPTLVVERRPQLSSLPRATVVSTRSMEIFRSFGLEPSIRAGAADVEWQMLSVRTLAEAAGGVAIAVGLPTRQQAAVISPTTPACVPQDHLEPLLLAHLRSLGGDVRLGAEITDVKVGTEGVRVAVHDVATGAVETVAARHLIAADGARSTVRSALGITMRGRDDLMGATSTLFRAPVWDVVGDHRYLIYDVNHPDGRSAVLPAGAGDRWVLGSLHEVGQGPPLDDRSAAARIRTAIGAPDLEVEILRTGRFTFAAQLADRFRQGPVFLVGDAAHRVTPRGGTGMNTAIHDGYDLGWKLGWVLNGWAPDGTARLLRVGAAAGGRAQRRPLGRSDGHPPPGRPGAARRPGRARSPPAGADGGRAALDSRPARPGADGVHRPGGGAAGGRPPAGRRWLCDRSMRWPRVRWACAAVRRWSCARMARRRRQWTGRGRPDLRPSWRRGIADLVEQRQLGCGVALESAVVELDECEPPGLAHDAGLGGDLGATRMPRQGWWAGSRSTRWQ